MSDLTRRGFVTNSATAAAGVTVIGALLADRASAEGNAGSEAIVAYVRDPRKGDISLLSADREVTVRDVKLAAQIARAARA